MHEGQLLCLIVDDQRMSLQLLEQLLIDTRPDLVVETYSSPNDLLRRAGDTEPDLIITDYQMPPMDGIELTTRLRGLPHVDTVPILMVTVVEDEDIEARALDAGVNDFLVRPIVRETATARCRNLIGMRERNVSLSDRNAWLESRLAGASREATSRETRVLQRLVSAVATRRGVATGRGKQVPRLARKTAGHMGLSAEAVDQIEIDATVYDIGMTLAGEGLVQQARTLSPDEHKTLEVHAILGAEFLMGGESLAVRNAAPAARHHHEQFDGTGYPDGIAGEEIPLSARLIAVIDAWDAMTHARADHAALSEGEALAWLESRRGSRFDPACVDAFVSILF
ncbi:MAG: response regulator [Pseudomonadota bacterium]|nr:response regulator [Pseudomonadota bacterium]